MWPKPGGLSGRFIFISVCLQESLEGPAVALQWRHRSEAEVADASLWLLPPLRLLK